MNLIKTFGLFVKPLITKGKGMWNPLDSQELFPGVFSVRDRDVNCFIVRHDKGFLAIDSGYPDCHNVREGLARLGINGEHVTDVFLTHLDIDHAGGVSGGAPSAFPRATIHIGSEESKYLNGTYARKTVLGHRCKLPIRLSEYKTFADGETFLVGGVSIQAIATPGHTLGHTSYVVDEAYVFSGDCIIANHEGGWLFYDFWNQNSEANRVSVQRLQEHCARQDYTVITSHSGHLSSLDAFAHCDASPDWRRKGFEFCRGIGSGESA